ncbi:hypothetical protein J6590_010275 [Homalodisca vitripennis]|nr:hypothetical protein J6590_010275 [Homalodisca vitripennis]
MNIYFHWFTFCLFFKTYVMCISIHNFRPINMSELTQLVGPQAEKILRKVIPRVPRHHLFTSATLKMLLTEDGIVSVACSLPSNYHILLHFTYYLEQRLKSYIVTDNTWNLRPSEEIQKSWEIRHSKLCFVSTSETSRPQKSSIRFIQQSSSPVINLDKELFSWTYHTRRTLTPDSRGRLSQCQI